MIAHASISPRRVLAFFGILCLALATGGTFASPLDAEETGYLKQFQNTLVGPQCRAAVENSYDQQKYRDLQDAHELEKAQRKMATLITRVRDIARQHLARVEIALPPASLRDLHSSRVAFFRYAKEIPDAPQPPQVDEFVSYCKAFYLYGVALGQTFSQRKDDQAAKGTLRLTFEPIFTPLSYNLIDGSFTVKQSLSLPIGTLTVGYTNTSGAKLLIIRSEERERYFALNQAFEVFVPSSYGVLVKSDGGGTIVLEVVSAR